MKVKEEELKIISIFFAVFAFTSSLYAEEKNFDFKIERPNYYDLVISNQTKDIFKIRWNTKDRCLEVKGELCIYRIYENGDIQQERLPTLSI